jgi:peptidyl-prolyl cis-trans isomerase C
VTFLADIRAYGVRLLAAIFTIAALVLTGCGDEPSKTSEADKAASPSGAAGEGASTAKDGGEVVARVNGTAIRNMDLELAEAEIGNNLGSLPDSTRRRVLVEYLVENQLFADAALKEDLASGPEFDRRLEYWRLRALREAYFEQKVKSQIGEQAARQLYDDRVKMIPAEEEVEARHILVPKEDEANELVKQLETGADFAELAKKHSGDAGSKEKGGMLGYFGKGQMVPQFEQAAFALKAGEISKPVKSQFGWHIIKVENRRQKPPPSFDEVKDRIIGTLVHQRAQKVAEDLRKDAKVEYIDPEIKALVEADDAKKAKQQELIEQQMKKQIENMKIDEKGSATSGDAPKTEAPAANN